MTVQKNLNAFRHFVSFFLCKKIVTEPFDSNQFDLLSRNGSSKLNSNAFFSVLFTLIFYYGLYREGNTRVDNPEKSIGGHRSSTTVPSVATSMAVTDFAVAICGPLVGIGGHRWAIGGDQWATDGPSVGYGGPPQRLR